MIIVRIWEGLGNQMFQYAYARALREKGADVRLDLGKSYDGVFERFQSDDVRKVSIQNFRLGLPEIHVPAYGKYFYLRRHTELEKFIYWLNGSFTWKYRFYEERSPEFSEKMLGLKGNWYVKGWFQSEKYFAGIRDILLREFTPKQKIKLPSSIRELISYRECISVHVRRGDYVRIGNALSPLYYQQAVRYFKKLYKDPVFLIYSDDLAWTREHLDIDAPVVCANESGRLRDYEELLVMSRCPNHIIANSTFSWWAAWLDPDEDKHVVAPRQWFPGKGICFPDGWQTI